MLCKQTGILFECRNHSNLVKFGCCRTKAAFGETKIHLCLSHLTFFVRPPSDLSSSRSGQGNRGFDSNADSNMRPCAYYYYLLPHHLTCDSVWTRAWVFSLCFESKRRSHSSATFTDGALYIATRTCCSGGVMICRGQISDLCYRMYFAKTKKCHLAEHRIKEEAWALYCVLYSIKCNQEIFCTLDT